MPFPQAASCRALIRSCFLLLGAQVGVRAVGTADLYRQFRLTPFALGLVTTAGVACGIVVLVAGGRFINRFGSRSIQVTGLVGTGASYVLTAQAHTYSTLVLCWMLYGLVCSLVDLGCNALASDYEHAAGRSAMVGFHSWVSLGAALGAGLVTWELASGYSFRFSFTLIGVALVGMAHSCRAPWWQVGWRSAPHWRGGSGLPRSPPRRSACWHGSFRCNRAAMNERCL